MTNASEDRQERRWSNETSGQPGPHSPNPTSDDGTEIAGRVRGDGLSEHHDDQRPERHMEDLAAFIDSIGEPVYWLDEQLTDSQFLELPGLGHMAPELGSEAVVEAIAGFFAEVLTPG